MSKNRSRGKASSVATLDIESKIAKSKRELQGVKRAISQVKREELDRRGGGLFGKMPSMFVSVPAMLGGAEAYFQEITSASSRAFNNAFGKNKGSRQLQLEAFKSFEQARMHDTKDQVDYITLASTLVPVIAYNLSQALPAFTETSATEIQTVVLGYKNKFAEGDTVKIEDALKAAVDMIGEATPELKIYVTKKASALIYPLNIEYIKARDKMIGVEEFGTTSKAKFLTKPDVLTAYRRYSATVEPPRGVAVPSVIKKEATGSGEDAQAKALIKFFRESSTYSLEDSFAYYREAFNNVASSHTVRKSQEIAKGIKVIGKAFDKFIMALEDSMYDDSVPEARELKNNYFDYVSPTSSADDFLTATALLEQARNPEPMVIKSVGGKVDLDALGFNTFSSLDLIDILRETSVANVSAADSEIWTAFHKIQQLNEELMSEALSVAEQQEVNTALAAAIAEATEESKLDIVDDTFKDFANDTLKDVVDGIVTSFNKEFATEISASGEIATHGADIGNYIASVINNMFAGNTVSDTVVTASLTGTTNWSLKAESNLELKDVALLDLADGESLDIYIENESDSSLDQFASRECELLIESIRGLFIENKLKLSLFSEIENFLRDAALEAQEIFDSIHMDASRREDIAIFRSNPGGGFGYLGQTGIGALALVGTHAVTALTQRFANNQGSTEGFKFYASEYLPALAAAGAGAYMYHKEERADIGLPLIGGAIGSVLLRMLTRRYVNKDNFVSKYILGYLGAAPAELIGDKTLGRINLEVDAPILIAQANAILTSSNVASAISGSTELAKAQADAMANIAILQDKNKSYADQIKAYQDLEANCKALGTALATATVKAVSQVTAQIPQVQVNPQINTNAMNLLAQSQEEASIRAGLQQVTPATEPAMQGYIEDANTEMYQYPRMYAAPAGLGKYVSTHMHDPFYSYNPPTELTFGQAEKMLQQGYQLAGYDHQEAMEILQTAQPLGAHELQAEGLGGYVNETIIRATPASAQKLQNAGVADAVGQSSVVPNSYLMKIGTTGEEGPITPEYNPSLPSGVFAPQQIEPAQYSESVASGLFSRGAFASRLPSAEDGFDY